ncbi:hypothetical protein GGR56DRAFT_166240 [Xylariaceae sp. FL0804]|nr:hypothetical protein GGR56DRAFT_166240 [Xylariaceae sp. FL0804]
MGGKRGPTKGGRAARVLEPDLEEKRGPRERGPPRRPANQRREAVDRQWSSLWWAGMMEGGAVLSILLILPIACRSPIRGSERAVPAPACAMWKSRATPLGTVSKGGDSVRPICLHGNRIHPRPNLWTVPDDFLYRYHCPMTARRAPAPIVGGRGRARDQSTATLSRQVDGVGCGLESDRTHGIGVFLKSVLEEYGNGGTVRTLADLRQLTRATDAKPSDFRRSWRELTERERERWGRGDSAERATPRLTRQK